MLEGQNIVVFDLEIKNVIDGKNVTWKTYDKMGISVGCLFDFQTMDYNVYLDDNIQKLSERLYSADLVVGFNINGFDLPLLKGTPEAKFIGLPDDVKVYDLLYFSRISVGFEPALDYSKYPSGLKLDDHLEGTFGIEHKKTDNGANAPILYQEKKMGSLISYCLADVKRETKLFAHVWDGKPVITKTHGAKVLRAPQQFLEV